METRDPEKDDICDRVENLYSAIGAKPDIQYPPGFEAGPNVTYDGKAGKAKLTLPALGEIMKMLGSPPRIFTMPIELKSMGDGCPLTNTIWMSPDIAAAIEEHMTAQKQKAKALTVVETETEKDLNHE